MELVKVYNIIIINNERCDEGENLNLGIKLCRKEQLIDAVRITKVHRQPHANNWRGIQAKDNRNR